MGLGDRIRNFFARRANPELRELEAFVAERQGIEGYLEPRTATSPPTLLLVDRSGDHRRGSLREPSDARAFCEPLGIPLYDAQVVGYPQRMKDFERGRRAVSEADLDREIAELERRLSDPD